MSLADLIIVYLSLGAPSAVYDFLENSGRSRRTAIVSAITVFLFWPPKAAKLLFRQFRRASLSMKFDQVSELDSAIASGKARISNNIMASAMAAREKFEFRDVLDRYIGLSHAAKEDEFDDQTDAALFEIAGRKDAKLGTVCLKRRNAARLARHQTDAGGALSRAIEKAAAAGFLSGEDVKTAAELAEMLGDGATEKKLREFHRRNYLSIPEGVLWKSEPKPSKIDPTTVQLSAAATATSKSD